MTKNHGNHQGQENNPSQGGPDKPVSSANNQNAHPGTGAHQSQGHASKPKGAGHQPEGKSADVVDEANGDALSQAEEIVNGAAESAPASKSNASESEDLRNDLLRVQAEYVNYRKRVERDRAVAGEMAVIGVLNSILPVLDDIDAGRAAGDITDGPFAAIATKLESVLTKYGLERIDETGVEFDPNIHEALLQQPNEDVQVDTVEKVLRSGYRTKDRVLRAAQVMVGVPN